MPSPPSPLSHENAGEGELFTAEVRKNHSVKPFARARERG